MRSGRIPADFWLGRERGSPLSALVASVAMRVLGATSVHHRAMTDAGCPLASYGAAYRAWGYPLGSNCHGRARGREFTPLLSGHGYVGELLLNDGVGIPLHGGTSMVLHLNVCACL